MSLTPSPAAAGPRRRSLLTGALGAAGAAGAAGLLSSCSDAPGSGGTADGERSDDAKRLRARTARESETLLARYDGTVAVHPALAERLRPLREEVAQHTRVLRDVSGTTTASPSPSGSPAPSGPAAPSGASLPPSQPGATDGAPNGRASPSDPGPRRSPDKSAVPHEEKAALAALAGAERRLADARTKQLADAPPELARLLASVAACGGAHVYLLEEGGASS